MKFGIGRLLLAGVVALSGCAGTPQQNVELAPNILSTQSGRVGIVMPAIPQVDTYFPGADCLLCIAAASLANAQLTSYTQKLPTEDLTKMKNDVADLLRKKGVDVMLIDENLKIDSLPASNNEAINVSRKDFTSLKNKYGIDKVLVMEVNSLGIWRNYSSYFPTGEPYAALNGAGYLVNLNNNTYEWYTHVRNVKTSEGKWDEPPAYPGLTNAYFQVIELSKDVYLKPFKK